MLVLSRTREQVIDVVIPPSDKPRRLEITVVRIQHDKVRLGFEADESIVIHRREVTGAIEREIGGQSEPTT